MLRLSKMADYGIALLTHMAQAGAGARFNARQLARETGLPWPTTAKLLKLLTKDGVLSATRGQHGGYLLRRPAAAITAAELIAILEGPIALTACCAEDHAPCTIEPTCPSRPHLAQVNQSFLRAMAALTLADLAAPTPSPTSQGTTP